MVNSIYLITIISTVFSAPAVERRNNGLLNLGAIAGAGVSTTKYGGVNAIAGAAAGANVLGLVDLGAIAGAKASIDKDGVNIGAGLNAGLNVANLVKVGVDTDANAKLNINNNNYGYHPIYRRNLDLGAVANVGAKVNTDIVDVNANAKAAASVATNILNNNYGYGYGYNYGRGSLIDLNAAAKAAVDVDILSKTNYYRPIYRRDLNLDAAVDADVNLGNNNYGNYGNYGYGNGLTAAVQAALKLDILRNKYYNYGY